MCLRAIFFMQVMEQQLFHPVDCSSLQRKQTYPKRVGAIHHDVPYIVVTWDPSATFSPDASHGIAAFLHRSGTEYIPNRYVASHSAQ